ncbi:hypothetical protein I4U23_011481 [Adineta vaga]|nr:hypothetical protein I4U23_011481 [Adineta vaga]
MGCSSSKMNTATALSTIWKSDVQNVSLVTTADPQPTRILENCIILLLTDEPSIKIDQAKAQLCKIVCTLKIFTDVDACITFAKNTQVEKLFLIVPAAFIHSAEYIAHLPQLEKIYIFDSCIRERVENEEQTNIFGDFTLLCQQLQNDIELYEFDCIVISSVPISDQHEISFSNATKQEASFLFTLLRKEDQLRFKFENEAKNEFVTFCRTHYAQNNEQLQDINDFEKNYRPQKALWWLTQSCFVSRMLNRAECTKDYAILYKIGFFVKHVQTQLTIRQDNTLSQLQNILIVYRGKTMSSDKSTIFRIESVEQATDYFALWNVKLTLIDDDDEQLLRFMKPLENNDVLADPLRYMGALLIRMDESQLIEKFYLGLLHDPSALNQPRRLIRVHNGLAAYYAYKKEYAKALDHSQKSLDIGLSYLPPEHPDLVSLYVAISDIQREQGNHSQAVTLLENNQQKSNEQSVENLQRRIISTRQLLQHEQ